MDLSLHNGAGSIAVSDAVFGADAKPALVHQVITAYMAGARAGTKAQKNRAAVSGGGSKPWRQKGTGRARAGTSNSPIWVGGGRAFAAQPRSFDQKVNRKMYRGAVRAILSDLVREERLVVVPEFGVSAPKTKELAAKLKEMDINEALIVTDELSTDLVLASRNLPKVGVLLAAEVDPVSLVAFDKVVMTEAAVKKLEERLQ